MVAVGHSMYARPTPIFLPTPGLIPVCIVPRMILSCVSDGNKCGRSPRLRRYRRWRGSTLCSGVYWGVGLSPFALYRHYGAEERRQLRRKLADIAQLEAPLLAILFDDMPGDMDALAARQAEIISDVCRWCPGVRILVCPTYYSFDPVLEKHFGSMPVNYWADLGREMPGAVDIFWTGNKVCSDAVRVSDIETINLQLGRPVMLWDNYPVNDGALRSNSLYLEKLARRDSGLRGQLSGHLCNPMNQGLLSLPALLGLAELYGDVEPANAWLSGAPGYADLAPVVP